MYSRGDGLETSSEARGSQWEMVAGTLSAVRALMG